MFLLPVFLVLLRDASGTRQPQRSQVYRKRGRRKERMKSLWSLFKRSLNMRSWLSAATSSSSLAIFFLSFFFFTADPRRSFSGCLHSVAWWAQTDDPAQ